jgi:hypothetical protein
MLTMNTVKAVSLLQELANGEDPVSGKPLPQSCPCHEPEVIRALFYAVNMMRKTPCGHRVKWYS